MSPSKRSSNTSRRSRPEGGATHQARASAGSLTEASRFSPVLAAAVAAAPTGVVVSDPNLPDCPIVFANAAFERITGYAPEEVVGRNCRFLQGRDTDPKAVRAIHDAIAARRAIDIELVNYRKDGRRFVNELHISPVFAPDGRLAAFLGIQHDVTARIRAEEKARRAQQRAERASAEKSDFLAFVSHEVRTPLNGVLGTLSLLLDTPLAAEQRAYAETARRSGEMLLWTVNEVLDLSRIEAGALEIEAIPFPLAAPLRDVLALASPLAAEKGLDLVAHVDPALPEWLTGDPARLRQVMLNLVDNAVKFTTTGRVELRLLRRDDRLVVEVQDSGSGIPAELRRRLFRRFQQADAGTARRHGGSGLGLMICRRLVGLMGGSIDVRSRQGEGSVFRFDLPLRPAAPQPLAPAAMPVPVDGTAQGRLLLAEDSEASQMVAAAFLRRAGYTVDLVRDGAEAVTAARSRAYDCILMDVRMPGLDGFGATAQIRAWPGEAGRVPILALTASAMPGDAARCLAAGMDAHLAKPVDRARLLGAVATLLGRGRQRADAEALEPGPAHALLGRETLEELRAAVGPGRLPELVEVFARETGDRLSRLAGTPLLELVEAEAHALQSAAGTFGAAALREAAAALELAAAAGNQAQVARMLGAMPELAARSVAALRRAAGTAMARGS
jgi:PAS domain S-box-containing protein